VATPTIYRRWHTKAQIALEIVRVEQLDLLPDTGDLEADLAAMVRLRIRTWGSPYYRRVVIGLLADAQVDEQQGATLAAVFAEIRKPLLERIQRSIEAGELETSVQPEEVLDQITGPLLIRLLFLRELPPESDAELLVARGLDGVSG
jgi:AcrR family transcriptional regulator